MAMGPMLRSRNFTAVPCADQMRDAAASKVKYHSILPFPTVLFSSVVVAILRSVGSRQLAVIIWPQSGRTQVTKPHSVPSSLGFSNCQAWGFDPEL